MFLTRAELPKRKKKAGPLVVASTDVMLRIEALMLRVFWLGSLCLGPERASNAGAWLINRLSGPSSVTIRRIRRNIRIAMPDDDDAAVDRLARQSLGNLGRSVAEYPHLKRIAGPELASFIEFVADVPEARLTPTCEPAIFIGVHQANWEILSSIAAPLGKPMTIVVSPMSNPYVNRLVGKARPEVWVEQSEKNNATRSLIRCLQEGRSVGLLADQRFDGGQSVPFFGHDAKTAIGPAKMAIKFGCDLVPTRIERVGPVNFRITTFAAIRPDDAITGDQAKAIDMMQRVNRHFEAWIREKPGEWMCMKRRWPSQVYQSHQAHLQAAGAATELSSPATAQ
ncbi:MAG: lysophospholipid acyltransferase family protein [Geminicoccaceae bacterium]